MWAGIPQTVQRLATGWTVRGSNIGRGEIFRTRLDRPWGPHSFLYNGYRVFSGGKVVGAWLWPPPPSNAEVNERAELNRCSPSGLSWPVLGWNVPLPLLFHGLITDFDCTYTPPFLTLKDTAFRQRIVLHFCVSMTLIIRQFSCHTISQHRTSTKHRQLTLFPAISFTSLLVLAIHLTPLSFPYLFLGIPLLLCPWGSNSKLAFLWQTNPYSLYDQPSSISALPLISLMHASKFLHLR